ncbi:recombinase family protein [Nocardia sp. NEAU-G5]|uniref:Recombinase family protein n=1 Tax=Nocardia albiluteola TaxID=2842303 RepID=A0ABS6AWW5_9NOCA|nr:recombinase family protein [Nocardia albiluteola]MBU3065624.1 recombinase family protein [Nocardia albiluteola]
MGWRCDRWGAGRRRRPRPPGSRPSNYGRPGCPPRRKRGRWFFQILGAIAEFEHALMSERTRDGLAAARARGPR